MRPTDAGWSSLVARRAHNPKVVGSNPAPATKHRKRLLERVAFFVRACFMTRRTKSDLLATTSPLVQRNNLEDRGALLQDRADQDQAVA